MTLNSTRDALASSLQNYLDLLEQAKFVAAESFAESIAEALAESTAAATALYVVYYYDLDELRDEIYMLTHYKAKNIKSNDKEPKSRLDELTITQDEEEILDKLLKDAAKDVYKIIMPYGKNITGGYVFNPEGTLPVEYDEDTEYDEGDLFYVGDQLYYTLVDDVPAGTDPEDVDYFSPVGEWYNTYHKIVYTLHYSANVDASMISILNEDIQDAILKHCLSGWYRMIQEKDMIPLAAEEYDDAVLKVGRSVRAEITPSRRRTEIL